MFTLSTCMLYAANVFVARYPYPCQGLDWRHTLAAFVRPAFVTADNTHCSTAVGQASKAKEALAAALNLISIQLRGCSLLFVAGMFVCQGVLPCRCVAHQCT